MTSDLAPSDSRYWAVARALKLGPSLTGAMFAELKHSSAWLYSEGFLTADEFRRAAPFITARSGQFRFNVIGYALPSGRYRIFEVVIDTADKQPQVSYLRDITKLGLPFALPSAQEMLDVQTSKQ